MAERKFLVIKGHVRQHHSKYSWGLIAAALLLLQMVWDVSANDIAAYFVPYFTALFGPPPAP